MNLVGMGLKYSANDWAHPQPELLLPGCAAPPLLLRGSEPTTCDIVSSHHLLMGLTNTASDLIPGTLELLVLKAVAAGAKHGYGIAEYLRITSGDVLEVGESALYPALQRLLLNGWVRGEWGTSENNRRARFYSLTAAGRRHLDRERAEFDRMVGLVRTILSAT